MGDSVYLDNAATTPVRPEVRAAMEPCLTEQLFGNPSSAHRFGRAARAAVEGARRKIAQAICADPAGVIFTSGGTEADNLAVIGAALAARSANRPFRVAVAATEHKAVLEAARAVEHLGGEAIVLPVDAAGQVDGDAVDAALAKGIALLSVMWVNNEVGVIQDIPSIARRAEAANTAFHTDAVQALGKLHCVMREHPIALMTISGHKIGAPKGVGALVAQHRDMLQPLIHGGGQQLGLRPGTENVPGSVGLGVAVELAVTEVDQVTDETGRLRDALESRLRQAVPDLRVNGADAPRAPHISNMSFPGTDGESLLMHLDVAGIACSSGSACTTGSIEPSHVLTAMGVPTNLAIASVRFSFSHRNSQSDVDRVVSTMPKVVEKVRKLTESLGR